MSWETVVAAGTALYNSGVLAKGAEVYGKYTSVKVATDMTGRVYDGAVQATNACARRADNLMQWARTGDPETAFEKRQFDHETKVRRQKIEALSREVFEAERLKEQGKPRRGVFQGELL